MSKISIIIPVYNSEKYLEECLDSVLRQTFTDYEVIIVDNSSTDTSMEIAERYAKVYPCINIIKHETNRGLLQSRITGAKNAQGEYLMNIDSDDFLTTETALETLNYKIDVSDADIIQFNISSDADWGEWFTPHSLSSINGDKIKHLYFGNIRCSTLWSRLIKKELYLKAISAIPRDINITMSEDVAQMPIIMNLAESYIGIDDRLYHYRVHGGGTQQHWDSEKIQTLLSTTKKILDILSNNILEENYKNIRNMLCDHVLGGVCTISQPIPKSANIFGLLLQCFTPETVLGCIFSWSKDGQTRFFSKISWTHTDTNKAINAKNIGFITRNMSFGGGERADALQLTAFVEHGYKVTLFTSEPDNKRDFKYSDKIERVDVSSEPSKIFAECQNIVSTYSDIDVFIIHDHDIPESYSYMIALKFLGKKVIVSNHQDLFFSSMLQDFPWMQHRISVVYSLIYQNMDAVTCLIPYNVDYLQSIGVNSYVVSNFPTYEMSDEVYEKDNTIVWCGRMSIGKNPLDVVKAFHLAIPHINPDIRLVLVGDGNDSDIVKKYIHENELKARIVLTGHTDPKPYYQKASLHITTSSSEAFPLVIFETKVLGVPTLMYELPDIVFSKTKGLISVPQSDIKALSDKIVELFNTTGMLEELGNQARESALDFTPKKTMENWDRIIDDVCNNRTNEYKPSTQDLQYVIKKLNNMSTQMFLAGYRGEIQETDNRVQKIIDIYDKLKSIFNRFFPLYTRRRAFVIKILKFGYKVLRKIYRIIKR